ncbi:DNA-(apurinic or apyrimidinic site) lyase [Podochytrium sp. JEL0797]|nr:DNA-(apurinic or apyrimidinic site) lyase [Podochytrium sp. JEL0797]
MAPKRKQKPAIVESSSDSEAEPQPASKTKTKTKTTKEKKPVAKKEPVPKKEAVPSKKAKIAAFAAECTDSSAPVVDAQRRLDNNNKWVGPHASSAGGAFNAVGYTQKVGGESFALFLGSQRTWARPPLTQEAVDKFKQMCVENQFDKRHIMPHGSYLINLGNPDPEKRSKGLEAFLEDVRLGIELYNFHPGSTVGECTPEESIKLIASGINEAIAKTPTVIIVIENMAGQGNVIGGKFEHLRDIIELVDDKTRIGVCLDTCHMFAAGYDIRTAEKFDVAMHLNDSMMDLCSGEDRHNHIGNGKSEAEAFRFIMNDDRFNDMLREVPVDPKTEIEIKLMYSSIGKEGG